MCNASLHGGPSRRRFRPPAPGALARLGGLLVGLTLAGPAPPGRAHEGHEPLPAKGVLVDVEAGTIALSRAAHRALRIETAEVTTRPLDARTLAYARLVPAWNRHAFAATGIGGRVAGIHVRAGDRVEAGQVLATIESLALETIQLELLAARTEHALAAQTLERIGALAEAEVATGRELSEARARWEQVRGEMNVAATKLRGLGVAEELVAAVLAGSSPPLSSAVDIVSPIAGTVMHVDVMAGDTVQSNEHLFEVVDLSEVWAEVHVLERDVNQIAVGQRVELVLSAFPGEHLTTQVHATGLMLDPQTKLGTVWAVVANPSDGPPRFLPGMTGQAQIVKHLGVDRIAVPAAALVTNGVEKYVLVQEAATKEGVEFRKQNVVVEGTAEGVALLRDGNVFPGDLVVTEGSHELGSFFISGVLRLSPEAEANMGLRTEPAGEHAIDEVLEFDGLVDVPPTARAIAAVQTEGRVTQILCRIGQAVAAGDVLAEIASLEVLDLQNALIEAGARRRLHDGALARLKTLDATQSVPQKRVWETQAAAITAAERVEGLSRKLLGIGFTAAEVAAVAAEGAVVPAVRVRAPVAGTVVRLDVVPGQVVQPDQPVAEIHDPRHAWVRAHLVEREVGRLPAEAAVGRARVRFMSLPERVFPATVARRGSVVDATDRTLPVWLEIDVPPDTVLQHNMLARVTLPIGRSPPVLAVPVTAVVRTGTQAHVFVRDPDGSFRRVAVGLGRSDDRFVAVAEGLRPGDVVAVAGVADLQTAFASIR